MNQIRAIERLNETELANVTPPSASWHADYRDTSFVYIGGLPTAPEKSKSNPNPSNNNELTEGDIITIFSQYGEPVYINMVRDKETGRSKGFAFLKYEDQRSCDLTVDNLGGALVLGRKLRVEHVRYKVKEGEKIWDNTAGEVGVEEKEESEESEEERPLIKEERELAILMKEHDDEDPMKAYLVEQKREEVKEALANMKDGGKKEGKRKHRHRHRVRSEDDVNENKERRHKDSREKRDVDDDSKRRRRKIEDQSADDKDWSERRRRRSPDRDNGKPSRRGDIYEEDRRPHKTYRSRRDEYISGERSRSRERRRSRRYS